MISLDAQASMYAYFTYNAPSMSSRESYRHELNESEVKKKTRKYPKRKDEQEHMLHAKVSTHLCVNVIPDVVVVYCSWLKNYQKASQHDSVKWCLGGILIKDQSSEGWQTLFRGSFSRPTQNPLRVLCRPSSSSHHWRMVWWRWRCTAAT